MKPEATHMRAATTPPMRAAGARRLGMPLLGMLLLGTLLAGCTTSTVVRRERGASASRPAPPKPGSVATVRKGDTLYGIATRHGLSPLDVATWNRIPPPYTIYPGQRLRLSAPGDTPPRTVSNPNTGTRPPATNPRPRPPAGGTATTPRPTTGAPAVPTPPPVAPVAAFAWQWPADGALLQRYAAGDPTRQGIAIAGNSGDPVRAAADGVVVYSGAGLIGYGELIIVKHDEQWLSAYAHNRARLVNEGQRVKAGERIAELGRSGAARDMLRFEIRYNGKPQDPLLSLPKR